MTSVSSLFTVRLTSLAYGFAFDSNKNIFSLEYYLSVTFCAKKGPIMCGIHTYMYERYACDAIAFDDDDKCDCLSVCSLPISRIAISSSSMRPHIDHRRVELDAYRLGVVRDHRRL